MPKFQYAGEAVDGSIKRGMAKADTIAEARRDLEGKGLHVSDLVAKKSIAQIELTKSRIKKSDLMHMSRQLAAFIRAGIPILDAISELRDEADSRAVKRVMTAMGEALRTGSTLSEAADEHPQDFPAFYRGILRSAELTGQLDTVLDQLSIYVSRDLEAKRKMKSAMIYPAILMVMSIGTIAVMMLVVLPSFKELFASFGAELPAITQLLMNSSDFISRNILAELGTIVAIVALYHIAIRFRAGRKMKDRILLRMPVLGPTIRYGIIERFTRILASMVSAGIPLPDAMVVATESLQNLVFEDALVNARNQMMSGNGLATPISQTRLFPGMASQMIRVGENTGSLDTQLVVAAGFYEGELDYKIKRLATLMEPLVIIIMGGIVGFVAIAIVSAMYGIFKVANI